MNRLVIIGNGFDLAHGMKTSYKDFIKDVLYSAFSKASVNLFHEDDLIVVKCINNGIFRFNETTEVNEYLNFDITKHNDYNELNINNICDYINTYKETKPFFVFVKSYFFNHLLNSFFKDNWVDVEKEYYQSLLNCFIKEDTIAVKKLNDSFEVVTKRLTAYLKGWGISSRGNPRIVELFTQDLLLTDEEIKANKKSGLINIKPNNIRILNFNYTTTINSYIVYNHLQDEVKEIQIHGSIIEADKNPVIFGYGDEMDSNFKAIEDLDDNEYLKYFKSKWYSKTNNYQTLFNFLALEDYEVIVIGHSCGTSDRVMLNAIFEEDKCKRIKIIHYLDNCNNNYDEIYLNISRHFTMNSRHKMRLKIMRFNPNDYLPN